ncbi:MAG: hypothetical protein FJ135_04185 [Deltaproteobacteria bacterium]|nr:hypothetical protein [Deltaproteobacteria bacterium]
MKKLLTPAFLLALGLLLAAEAGVRLLLPDDVSGRFSYGYHPDAGFVESKDGTVRLVRAGGRRFLPQTFSRQPETATWRILVLGDSVPRGPFFQAAYPWRLQETLQQKGTKTEVLNLAVAGYGARRNQLVLRKALEYNPHLVILHLNDSNEYEDEREYRRRQDFHSWHPRHWPMKSYIFARAYEIKTEKIFWKLLPDKIRRQSAVNDAEAELRASLNEAQVQLWREQFWQTTRESAALVRQQGLPLVLVIQGVLQCQESGGPSISDQELAVMAHSLQGPGVYLLSMKQVFSPLAAITQCYADSAHLTPYGHLVLAQALAELVDKHLVQKLVMPQKAAMK